VSRWLIILLLFLKVGVASAQKISAADPTGKYLDEWAEIVDVYQDSVELVVSLAEELIGKLRLPADSIDYIRARKYQGRAHRVMGNYVKSIGVFREVYKFATKYNDSIVIAEAADQIATMNTFMGNMSEAQDYLLQVVNIYNKIGSDEQIANSNNGLAIFYSDIDRVDEAIKVYKLALSQSEAIDDTMGRANIHANLGMVYLDQGAYDLAEEHILMQGYLDTLMNTQWGLGFHHDFMGSLRRRQGRLEEALRWKQSSLDIRSKLSSHYNRAESISGLASVYLEMGQYDQAIANANLILERKEQHQSLSQQMSAFSLLSRSYAGKEDYKRSLDYYKDYKSMSDSIYNRDMLAEIANKDALYQKARKDEEIAVLNAKQVKSQAKLQYKNRIIIICMISLAIISMLISLLFSLYRKVMSQKDQLAESVSEKDLLLREVHHRVKNNLQLVSSLLTLQGRSIDDVMAQQAIADGKSRVRSMALIHQDLYNRENLSGIGVKVYLEKLTKELFAAYQIDGNEIRLEMKIQDLELDVDTMVPLGLIINELITNSLKYAFDSSDSGVLKIALFERENPQKSNKESIGQLVLKIEDDGKGFDQEKVRHNTFGTTLVKALTEQLGGVISTASNNGTTITIVFKEYRKT